MKKFLLGLTALALTVMSHPALAEGGRHYEESGCNGDDLFSLFLIVVVLGALVILLFLIAIALDVYKYGKETGSWPIKDGKYNTRWNDPFNAWQERRNEKIRQEIEETKNRRM